MDLEEAIKRLKEKLSFLIEEQDISDETVLKCSQELDRLIIKFYETIEK
ncbi:MAG: aspartyl-phosphate phosphatase Spo0E family protein [Bacillota bacterium]|nr:aspartyl-phosphate phosphatase Spo0E family protein [Bacillota bacterium]